MKLKFTKASNNDGNGVVTLRTVRLVPLKQGETVYLFIKARWSDSVHVVKFVCNRSDGSTVKTTEWPKRFAQPSVGNPVEYKVVEVLLDRGSNCGN